MRLKCVGVNKWMRVRELSLLIALICMLFLSVCIFSYNVLFSHVAEVSFLPFLNVQTLISSQLFCFSIVKFLS